MYYKTPSITKTIYERDSLRLEAVTTCVGFDDFLDETLSSNHSHFDTFIVVTSHDDKKTQQVAQKHGAICVQTDLFKKNDRAFNKGAAINAGFNRFQYYGWRLHLDADIVAPDNFRRILFNHTHLDTDHIYGADRINIVGRKNLHKYHGMHRHLPQSKHGCLIESGQAEPIGARYVDPLIGYCPLGFFQLWHASNHKQYPYSLGDASHDDVMFAQQWAREHRVHLPTVITHQLCAEQPKWGENWNGRKHKQF